MRCNTLALKDRISSRFLTYFFFLLLSSLLTVTASQARDVSLQWDAATDTAVTGYKLYYNTNSAAQPFSGTGAVQGASPINVNKLTSSVVTGLDPAKNYYFAVTAYNASGTESSYSNIATIAEAVPPTVAITAPASNATVSGTVSVTASAADNVAVTKVEFYLNGVLKSSDTSTPYLYSLSSTTLAVGTNTLMAKAYDAAGNVGQSSNVSISVVNDTTAPTVSLTAPANNATVSGSTTLSAAASDNVGISKVEFYSNGALLSATNVSPFNYSWNTTSVANGSYTLIARAYDNTGNVAQSANVTVTVNNSVIPSVPAADTISPFIRIGSALADSSVKINGTVYLTVSPTANVAVSKVEYYINGVLDKTLTLAPFSYRIPATMLQDGSYNKVYAKAYDAASNVSKYATIKFTIK